MQRISDILQDLWDSQDVDRVAELLVIIVRQSKDSVGRVMPPLTREATEEFVRRAKQISTVLVKLNANTLKASNEQK